MRNALNKRECNTHITLVNSTACINMGGVDYTVLIDLKTLQGKKEPYFNATEIVKQYNKEQESDLFGSPKRLVDWTRSKRFKEIIEIVKCDFNTTQSRLYLSENIKGNRRIMLHKELFLSLMIWLDAKHEIAITQFVNRVVENIDQVEHIRGVSRSKHLNYTDELLLLQEDLKDEGSGSAPFIITTMQQKIHKKATGRSTKRGGVDHDTFEGEEDFRITKLRSGVVKVLVDCSDLTAREARDKAYQFIKDFK